MNKFKKAVGLKKKSPVVFEQMGIIKNGNEQYEPGLAGDKVSLTWIVQNNSKSAWPDKWMVKQA